MKKQLVVWLLALTGLSLNLQPAIAQSYPDPKVELISIENNHTYEETSKVSFTLQINRFNNSRYADQIRIWLCPESNWTGSICTAGFIAISSIPTSTATTVLMSTAEIVLNPGNYFVTSVTFKNGAVLAGYMLAYLRSGAVTIGGLITAMPWVDITAADFTVPAPAPEPVVGPEPEPQPEPQPDPDPTEPDQSTDSTEPAATEPDQSTDPNTPSSETNNETAAADPNESSNSSEPAGPESEPAENQSPSEGEVIDTPTTPADESESDNEQANPSDSEALEPVTETETDPTSTEEANEEANSDEGNQEVTTQITPDTTGTSNESESNSTQPDSNNNSNPITESIDELPEPAVNVPVEIKAELAINEIAAETAQLPEPTTISPQPSEAIVLPVNAAAGAVLSVLAFDGAIGGFVTKVIGPAKLERFISAGVGKLRLIGSSKPGILKIKIGSKEISQLKLNSKKRFTIKWYSNFAAKLKLVLIGDADAELLIDSIQINRQLFANPTFLMRN
jgi:hypothetical protein